MSQKQAAWASVGEFLQRREAYERSQQLAWERSRWIAYSIFSPFLGKNKPRTPEQWVKFPWEQQRKQAPMIKIDSEQHNVLNDIYKDFLNRKKA